MYTNCTLCTVSIRLWKINPPAVQREIEAIWESHVIDKVTGETDRPNAGTDRFDGEHFVAACVGLHGHALLNSYQLTGDPLFRDYAVAYLTAYANYGYDPKAEKFWGSLRLDGTAETGKRFLDGYEANKPRGHLDMWGSLRL